MEFGFEKCAMLKMKSGKRETMERINQLNKKSFKYHGIFEADIIKQTDLKEKVRSTLKPDILKLSSAAEIS